MVGDSIRVQEGKKQRAKSERKSACIRMPDLLGDVERESGEGNLAMRIYISH